MGAPDVSDETGLRDRAILEMLFSTGLRVSELVKLNRDQIDLERRELGIIGKGNRARVVFLSDDAAAWIKKYLDCARGLLQAPLHQVRRQRDCGQGRREDAPDDEVRAADRGRVRQDGHAAGEDHAPHPPAFVCD